MRLAVAAVERSPALRHDGAVGGERWRIVEAFCGEYGLDKTERRVLHRIAKTSARDVR